MANAIKKAIEKSVKSGWKPIGVLSDDYSIYHAFLDKDFWKFLGEAMNWNNKYCTCGTPCGSYNETWCSEHNFGGHSFHEWHHQWRCFIDHLAEGKDAESFFNKLIK